MIETAIPIADAILETYRRELGNDHAGYRNHVHRMLNYCFMQRELSAEEREIITIAGAFHDLGIWTADTFDYLPPSIEAAARYLRENDRAVWIPQITELIDQHHKLRRFPGDPLVEVFRRGDLADFSLGLVKCGIPRRSIAETKAAIPNASFHKMLVKRAVLWICRHPLDPLPVLKW